MGYDVNAVRAKFPVTQQYLYLDSGLQSPLSLDVKEAVEGFLEESLYHGGPKSVWMDRLEAVRAKVAGFFGVSASEIAFTKNTSEGCNIIANALPLTAGDNVLMLQGDHPNNTYAFLNIEKKGVEIRFLPMTEIVNADSFKDAIDARTRAISLSHITFHAGHKFDIENIAAFCKQKGILLIVDAMQSVGVTPIDLKQIGVSIMVCGSHKGLLVPQGLGILYISKDVENLVPTFMAAASLENPPSDFIATRENMALKSSASRFEVGNYNLPTITALGAAIDLIESAGIGNIEAHLYGLGDRLLGHLDRLGVGLVGPRDRENRAPHIYVICLDADKWVPYFAKHNVRVSPERDGVRISFALFNTADDVDAFAEVLEKNL
ncbi:aminotransferase class V-fold PLP-dependent enzyme [Pantoea sp. JGM49]|uniref:aminotransferase class V-fold PLP-dependent enzyme n=1 Tax=Pantoea sp. JGM49 TaxID=2799791 RepID=UPI001BA870F2|nr:aminotransferase class V-fold PLP-dependent enzyme [Pantoea sp. JGM49]MBS0883742.1 aminotransferase class V-fold PLP-dependent enzyme [Pantoea sp. JGM49]